MRTFHPIPLFGLPSTKFSLCELKLSSLKKKSRPILFHLVDGSKEQVAPELADDLNDLVRPYLK
jgi:hypothetical protein